ncbi:MAG: dihydroorotase, partial [Micromonosporaceae bacterium]
GVRDGRVAAVGQLDPRDGDRQLDASGKVVLPGAVDSHAHLGIYRDMTADAESETTSCLVGGVTSLISYFRTGHHYVDRVGPYREILPEALDKVAGHARIDYGFHLAPMSKEHIQEIPWLVDEMGVSSFKFFMMYRGMDLSGSSRDGAAYTMAEDYDLGHLYAIMEQVAAVDRFRRSRISVSVHCEQSDLLRLFLERARQDPHLSGLAQYAAARPPLSERLAIEEAGVLADATGAPMNLLHLSSGVAGRTAADLAARYPHLDLNLETTLHHLVLSNELLAAAPAARAGGAASGKVNPPIREPEDNEALWQLVRDGAIRTVVSDHACCTAEQKGERVWPAPPGFGGAALLYPLLLSEGHHKRGLSLSQVVDLVSTLPAQVFNLAPRKGVIAVGADADLAVVDLEREQVVTPELCRSAQDHSPFTGITVKGWPTATVLRGNVVYDGVHVSADFHGRYLRRLL